MPSSLDDLTPAQREAVTHREGPLLVLAGAGSGKTRVITRRVARLVEDGVEPRQILAITFTNKAAGEMRERIATLTGGARVWVSTFHAFCARTLRRAGERVGLAPGFTILDDDDQRAAVRESLVETGTDPKLYGLPRIRHAIDRHRDALVSPVKALEEAATPFDESVARAYAYYDELLRGSNALDFGGLLSKTVELLEDERGRQAVAGRFHYLLIDEYQDTNHAQYTLARLLAQDHQNICATGDPNQSIYAWRGADIRNILSFERDYPQATVVKLEENFRSTRTILAAANGLIRHNTERRDYELRTSAEEGAPLELHVLADEWEEARHVADGLQRAVSRGVPADELAVFYRANALSRALEVTLLERGLRFRVVGAVPFYQRKEVKDALAYLRLLHNPEDDLAFQRVVNVPPRGVGKGTLERLKQDARQEGGSLLAAAGRLLRAQELKGRGRRGLEGLLNLVARLRDELAGEWRVEAILAAALQATAYRDYLEREYPEGEEAEGRLLNLESLLAGAREFDRRAGGGPPGVASAGAAVAPAAEEAEQDGGFPLFALPPAPVAATPAAAGGDFDDVPAGVAGFLEQATLVAEREEAELQGEGQRVSLMTVHTAKGLEFDSVWVIGLEDGVFPNSRALEDPSGLEEERRLAYVAITRAKRRLTLCRARWRARHGRSQPQEASLFLHELPPEVFEAGRSPRELERAPVPRERETWGEEGVDPPAWEEGEEAPARPGWQRPLQRGGGSPAARPAAPAPRPAPAAPLRPPLAQALEQARARLLQTPAAPAAPTLAPGELRVGDRVRHEHFGPGVVEELSGVDVRRRARVRFQEHGVKSLVLQYARLTRLEPR